MKIENEFIPFEQALALKELGFDEPCLGYYIELRNPQEGILTIDKCENNIDGVLALLYQQSFRWFRKKYDLYPVIASYFGGAMFGIEDKNKNYHNKLRFKTHEEAELECLKELIKIVKDKA